MKGYQAVCMFFSKWFSGHIKFVRESYQTKAHTLRVWCTCVEKIYHNTGCLTMLRYPEAL